MKRNLKMKHLVITVLLFSVMGGCTPLRQWRVTSKTQRWEQKHFDPKPSRARKKMANKYNRKLKKEKKNEQSNK